MLFNEPLYEAKDEIKISSDRVNTGEYRIYINVERINPEILGCQLKLVESIWVLEKGRILIGKALEKSQNIYFVFYVFVTSRNYILVLFNFILIWQILAITISSLKMAIFLVI